MTGFGRSECEIVGKKVSIELRSLNSKQLDIILKLPQLFKDKEPVLRNEISKRFSRGKIEVQITFENRERERDYSSELNREVVAFWYEQISNTASNLGISNPDSFEIMKIALRMPETLSSLKPESSDSEWDTIFNTFISASENLENYRTQEGNVIATDIVERTKLIETLLSSIEKHENSRITRIRERLNSSLADSVGQSLIDKNRFEQELIYYLEKLDITEEKVRLKNHLNYLMETVQKEECAGKKIGFISQEIGREINTIGSKANDFDIQKIVVQMKDELEKIKEQSLNIL